MNIRIRRANENDIFNISELFYETIRNINIKDYNDVQVKAWTLRAYDEDKWKKKIESQYFIVAILNNIMVGFASIDESGYLDYMFVHKDFQRVGIAKKLLNDIEEKAKNEEYGVIYSHVSKTAKDFFISNGYVIELMQKVLISNVELINYKMVKKLK
ncbi:GNAT family N-acetyltransferase [Fusobacterium sp. PH5-44]|uniref:GNAT family N-acetyltransferase n=1 Tax=unclassified Fusobacterium TaxID=2648384 RepID=UPI003D1CFA67